MHDSGSCDCGFESRRPDSSTMNETTESKTNPYAVPAAILIAGALIAGAVYFGRDGSVADPRTAATVGEPLAGSAAIENIRPVTNDDHILGNLNAPVKIVEYSDLECPFCKSFHPTIEKIFEEYKDQVAWVYRHFPLTTIHPKAVNAAVASECAAEQGGNNSFWAYIDEYFEVTPSNNNIDLAELPRIASEVGLNRAVFEQCLASGKYDDKIRADFEEAVDSGGTGTPFSVVIAPSGKKYPILGAQPYEEVKRIIEEVLAD